MRPTATDDCALPAGISLLAAVTRADPPATLAHRLEAAQAAGQDLAPLARTHGLSSLLFLRFAEAGFSTAVPDDQWEELHRAHLVTAARSHATVSAATEVFKGLHAAGVRYCLPIKGVAMAAACWPDYLPRYTTDIDLLLAPEEMPTAIECLSGADWKQSGTARDYGLRHRFHLRRDDMVIDLHSALLGPDSPFRLVPVLPVSVATLFERSRPTALGDVRILGPEDDLITQAILLARDRYAVPFSRWADLYRDATQPREAPDWDELQTLAGRQHSTGLVWLALRFVEELFETPIPCSLPAGPEWEDIYTHLRPLLHRRLLLASQELLCANWLTTVVARRALQCPVTGPSYSPPLHADVAHSARRLICGHSLGPLVYPLYIAGSLLLNAAKLICRREARRGLRDDLRLLRALRALTPH